MSEPRDTDDLDEPAAPSAPSASEPSADDIARVTAALRATAPAPAEPDWAKLSADIGVAVDGAARTQRRTRMITIGGLVLAAAAVAALVVWPAPRRSETGREQAKTRVSPVDAAVPEQAPREPIEDDEDVDVDDALADEMALPDDLGGITLDDDLVDEAAAALDQDLGDEEDALDDSLLPDGAWIDDLSDDDLERAVEILDGETG